MNKFFPLIILLFGCSHKIQSGKETYSDKITKIEFCKLPTYEGKVVIIECAFSGVDEYWSISSPKRCRQKLSVELDYYRQGKLIPEKFQPFFDSVYSSYWNKYLRLKLMGTYESKNPNGYGHLGSNRSRFILDSILDLKVINIR